MKTIENHLVGVSADAPHPEGYRPDLPLNNDRPLDVVVALEEAKDEGHEEGYQEGRRAGLQEWSAESFEQESAADARIRKLESDLVSARNRIAELTEHAA